MITSLDRLGTEKNPEGWFLINKCVKVRYLYNDNNIDMDIKFDKDHIDEEGAAKLANELLDRVLKNKPLETE